jgi:phenylacetic acid degradation operon negative regulatory protein
VSHSVAASPSAAPPSPSAPALRAEAQPRRLLISLFGLFVRAEVNWISVAALIRLLVDLGVGAQAVRSSISRLKRRGALASSRHLGSAGYAPSAELAETLLEGDRRIFGRHRATLADGWVTVVFSVPEEERKKRHELRSALAAHGFGIMAPGVWIAPGTVADEAPEMLRRRHLDGYVTILHGQLVGDESLPEAVGRWWNLPELAAQYQQFIEQYEPLADRVAADGISDREAFVTYVPLVTAWRKLPYLDPGLPLELLPQPWPGARATELFHRLDAHLSAPAHRHATGVISAMP